MPSSITADRPCQGRSELFFSEKPEHMAAAKQICRNCPMETMTACFRTGLGSDIIAARNNVTPGYGVYAAMTPKERQPYVKRWMEQHSGVKRRHTWTPEMLTYLREAVTRGDSRVSIADHLGVSKVAVWRRTALERQSGNL